MLPILKPFLKQKGDPTAADCVAALEVVKDELQTTRERLGELRAKRADALVNGIPWREIDLVDTDIRHCDITHERLEIAGVELQKMIEQATARERVAQADAILKRAVEAKSHGLDLFNEYASHAARLVETLEELAAAEQAITAANAALAGLGDPRSVAGIEQSYWHEPIVQFPPWSLISQTRLPDPECSRRLLWPRGGQA